MKLLSSVFDFFLALFLLNLPRIYDSNGEDVQLRELKSKVGNKVAISASITSWVLKFGELLIGYVASVMLNKPDIVLYTCTAWVLLECFKCLMLCIIVTLLWLLLKVCTVANLGGASNV